MLNGGFSSGVNIGLRVIIVCDFIVYYWSKGLYRFFDDCFIDVYTIPLAFAMCHGFNVTSEAFRFGFFELLLNDPVSLCLVSQATHAYTVETFTGTAVPAYELSGVMCH